MKCKIVLLLIFSLLIVNTICALGTRDKLDPGASIFMLETEAMDRNIECQMFYLDSTESEKMLCIVYFFGDFFFDQFVNVIQEYADNNMDIILIGINEAPGTQFGDYLQQYASFVTDDLRTYCDERISSETEYVIFGHSRATRLVSEIFFQNRSSFDFYVLSAPWITDENYDRYYSVVKSEHLQSRLFVTMSEEGATNSQAYAANERFLTLLENQIPDWYSYRYFERETHMSIPPLSLRFTLTDIFNLTE